MVGSLSVQRVFLNAANQILPHPRTTLIMDLLKGATIWRHGNVAELVRNFGGPCQAPQ
jgi:hypothetical protein